MTQQELANASGTSLRTITSFEDSSDRLPIAANLAAIRKAFERLGVMFTDAGVEWVPSFSAAQMRAIRALQVRKGPSMCRPADLYAESGCSRGELEALVRLRIVEGIDTLPTSLRGPSRRKSVRSAIETVRHRLGPSGCARRWRRQGEDRATTGAAYARSPSLGYTHHRT